MYDERIVARILTTNEAKKYDGIYALGKIFIKCMMRLANPLRYSFGFSRHLFKKLANSFRLIFSLLLSYAFSWPHINFFAKTNSRGQGKIFGIKKEDRRYHMYIIGKTGMGKTTLLLNMILNDILDSPFWILKTLIF